jgi:multiple sugar transport system ATP-binding protein
VFLFDEPLSNLDAQLRNELRDEIKRLHHRLAATTMIYVTHDQIEAMTLADRIAVMKDQKIQQIGTPLDLYYRPANLFVAGFVGSPRMNFVEGRLEQAANGLTFAAGERRLALDGYPFGTRPQSGQPVTLGIRPEHIALDGAGNWNGFTVDIVEPLGADSLVWCTDGQLSLEVRISGEQAVRPGTPLALGIDANRISLFSTEGARL